MSALDTVQLELDSWPAGGGVALTLETLVAPGLHSRYIGICAMKAAFCS